MAMTSMQKIAAAWLCAGAFLAGATGLSALEGRPHTPSPAEIVALAGRHYQMPTAIDRRAQIAAPVTIPSLRLD